MSLIKCSECGKEISDKASICIHCGNPIKKEIIKTMKKKTWEELTIEEKKRVNSYRKIKKEWWNVPSRFFGFMLCIIALICIILGFLLGLNAKLIIIGAIFSFVGAIISSISSKETKTWYEKNIDRLYEDDIIK